MKTFALAVTILFAGCAVDFEDEEDVVGEVEQAIKPPCDEMGCGTNSPYFDNRGFYWLYKDSTKTTPDGFRIWKFTDKNGDPMTFDVIDSRIYGTKPGSSITGPLLVGSKLWVAFRNRPLYVIKIVAVDRVMSWAKKPNTAGYPIDTYWFQWSGDNEKFQDMCQGDHLDDEMGMNTHHTIVFEGDQIDAAKKTVASSINTDVVNFGCAGSALAKMALTAHNEVGAHHGYGTSPAERTTILKMFSADYCGDGTPFTVGGQKLQWADNQQWMTVQPFAQLEARWTPTGPACLNVPRIDKNPTPLSQSTFPSGAVDAIESHMILAPDGTQHLCQLPPPCPAGSSAYQPGGFHLISSNPVPLPIIIL